MQALAEGKSVSMPSKQTGGVIGRIAQLGGAAAKAGLSIEKVGATSYFTPDAAAKKAAAEALTPKKSTAEKSTAKKSTAEKSTAKKSTPKKSTAKKSTAKKSTPKKTSSKEGRRLTASALTLKKFTNALLRGEQVQVPTSAALQSYGRAGIKDLVKRGAEEEVQGTKYVTISLPASNKAKFQALVDGSSESSPKKTSTKKTSTKKSAAKRSTSRRGKRALTDVISQSEKLTEAIQKAQERIEKASSKVDLKKRKTIAKQVKGLIKELVKNPGTPFVVLYQNRAGAFVRLPAYSLREARQQASRIRAAGGRGVKVVDARGIQL